MNNIFDVQKVKIINELNVYDKIDSKLNKNITSFYKIIDSTDKIITVFNNSAKFENIFVNLLDANVIDSIDKNKIYIFHNLLSDEIFLKSATDVIKNGLELLLEPNDFNAYKIIEISNVFKNSKNETIHFNFKKILDTFVKGMPLSAEFICKNISDLNSNITTTSLIHIIKNIILNFESKFTTNLAEFTEITYDKTFISDIFFINHDKKDYLFVWNNTDSQKSNFIKSDFFNVSTGDKEKIFFVLEDMFQDKVYIRRLDELTEDGLFISLDPNQPHFFKIKKVEDNHINLIGMLFEQLKYKSFKSNEIFGKILNDKADIVKIDKYIPCMTNFAESLKSSHANEKWITKYLPELSDKTIVYMCMEMFISELYEQINDAEYNGAVDANFSGGLGILAGCTLEGFANIGLKSHAIIPMYRKRRLQKIDENLKQFIYEEEIDYSKNKNLTPTIDEETGLQLEIIVFVDNKKYTVKIWEIFRGNSKIYLLEQPEIFDILYTGDREQRLRQEVLVGKVAPALLKTLDIKPDIVHLNEAHPVLSAINMKEWKNISNGDTFFENTKFLFTIHTPRGAGMEVFFVNFSKLEIPYFYKSIFDKDNSGKLDFTNAAVEICDRVNTVSNNQIRIVKERIFTDPKHHKKIIGIMNGTSKDFWIEENIKPFIKMNENEFSFTDLLSTYKTNKKNIADYMKNIFVRENFHKLLGFENNENNEILTLSDNKPSAWALRRIVDYKNQWPLLKDIIRVICTEKGKIIETNFGNLEGLGFQVVIGGMAHPSDKESQKWIHEFVHWMKGYWREDLSKDFVYAPELIGNFMFLPSFSDGLGRSLKMSAVGCDVCLEIPMWDEEACGTSGMRAMGNGNICIDSSDGALEWLSDGKNSFLLKPYSTQKILESMQKISKNYYSMLDKEKNGKSLENDEFLEMKKQAILTWKNILNIDIMAKRYANERFYPAIKAEGIVLNCDFFD
jgi:starch phosphorylase